MKIETNDALSASVIGALSGKYIYGFDPASGDDVLVRTECEKLPDGSYKLLKIQHWNKEKEIWE